LVVLVGDGGRYCMCVCAFYFSMLQLCHASQYLQLPLGYLKSVKRLELLEIFAS
jgi:hypothetical protein